MLGRVIKKIRWADSNLILSLCNVFYYNVIKINRFAIFEFDLTQQFEGPSLDPQVYSVRVMNFGELEKTIQGKDNLPREFYMHSIDGVKYCTLIEVGEKIGHISWIYLKGDRNRWFDLSDNEAHVNYSYTFSDFRGMDFFPQALLASAKWLKGRKFDKILMDVHEETVYMLNSMKKIRGVKRSGTLKQWFFYRPKFKNKHVPRGTSVFDASDE